MALPITAVSNGNLVSQLRNSAAKWAASKAGSKLVVSPELSWWYWLEFGTAPYKIHAGESELLVFPHNGGKVFKQSVNHPGIKPHRMVRRVREEIHDAVRSKVTAAFIAGAMGSPEVLQEAIRHAVLEIKELITQSISVTVTGTRPIDPLFPKQSGKLKGRTAADVFNEDATVVQTT